MGQYYRYWGVTSTGIELTSPLWARYSFPYTSFSVADVTNTLTIRSGRRIVVLGIVLGVITPFSGGVATSVTVSLGTDLTDIAQLTRAYDVLAADPLTTQSTNTVQQVGLYAGETITITAQSDANLDTLTGGELEVWLMTSVLPY